MNFLEFLEKLRTVGLEWFKRYYSSYPGIVIDNNDPEKRGRVKLKIPTIFGSNYIHPVWAEPMDNRLAGKNTGEFFPPYVGDVVEVMFEYGDSSQPKYKGGYHAIDELDDVFKGSYPNIRGWSFKSGQQVIIDETKDKEKIFIKGPDGTILTIDSNKDGSVYSVVHSSGAKHVIDKDGNHLFSDKSGNDSISIKDSDISVISNGKVGVTGKADVSINGQGVASFSGKGSTNIGDSGSVTNVNGTSVNLGGGGSPVAKVGSRAFGIGNKGAPVSSTIISGSSKVTTS